MTALAVPGAKYGAGVVSVWSRSGTQLARLRARGGSSLGGDRRVSRHRHRMALPDWAALQDAPFRYLGYVAIEAEQRAIDARAAGDVSAELKGGLVATTAVSNSLDGIYESCVTSPPNNCASHGRAMPLRGNPRSGRRSSSPVALRAGPGSRTSNGCSTSVATQPCTRSPSKLRQSSTPMDGGRRECMPSTPLRRARG